MTIREQIAAWPEFPAPEFDDEDGRLYNRFDHDARDAKAIRARLATATEALRALTDNARDFIGEDVGFPLADAYADARAVLDALDK